MGGGRGGMRSAWEVDGRLEAQALRLAAVEEEVADVAAEMRRYTDTLDSDPGRLEAIEERLSVLEGIKRKHGGSLDAAIPELDKLERQGGAAREPQRPPAPGRHARAQTRARPAPPRRFFA